MTERALAAFILASATAFMFGAPIPKENAPNMIPKKHAIMSPGVSISPLLFVHYSQISIDPRESP